MNDTSQNGKEDVVQNPTWMEHIRHFFDEKDVECMARKGIDLATYSGVKDQATRIFQQTKPPDAKMPPQADRKWSAVRSETFLNWIVKGFARGSDKAADPPSVPDSATNPNLRVRKDIRELESEELTRLKTAFEGVQQKKIDGSESYFKLAGLHWFPKPTYCLHNEYRYNPWHRAFLYQFEDALRTISGCEDVSLPYWHITGPVPRVLFQAPFDKYVLPEAIGPAPLEAGYETRRNSSPAIRKEVTDRKIADIIESAMSSSRWEEFNDWIIDAHNQGHPVCGETMSDADAAAFDPLFWFFHANWDRLWWKWQHCAKATTLTKFKSTLPPGDHDWLTRPPFDEIKPFSSRVADTIDVSNLFYTQPDGETAVPMVAAGFGSLSATATFRVAPTRFVSIRAKNIDRVNIPGSFDVHLLANGESIAKQAFFQSTIPQECDNCSKRRLVNIDFRVGYQDIRNKDLSIGIKLVGTHADGNWLPLSSVGSPTVNIRSLLIEK